MTMPFFSDPAKGGLRKERGNYCLAPMLCNPPIP